MLPLVFVLTMVVAQPKAAPENAESAVKMADNAFKFRDFGSVVTTLDPWLHPPKILDRGLLIAARKLLGVSLHELGRTREAREEFGQLLLIDPKHELDPFVIPPNVIVTFEAVRTEMKPTLDRITGTPDPPPPDPGPKVEKSIELVEIPSRATMFLPGGIPQFLLDEPGWGATWLAVQVASLVLNFVANRRAATAEISRSEYRLMIALQYVGVGTLVGGWAGSTIQGLDQLEDYRAARLEPPSAPTPPEVGVRLRF